jgi:hypothetical protein
VALAFARFSARECSEQDLITQSHVEDDPERRQWLNDMGFVWDDLERQWEVAKEALST